LPFYGWLELLLLAGLCQAHSACDDLLFVRLTLALCPAVIIDLASDGGSTSGPRKLMGHSAWSWRSLGILQQQRQWRQWFTVFEKMGWVDQPASEAKRQIHSIDVKVRVLGPHLADKNSRFVDR